MPSSKEIPVFDRGDHKDDCVNLIEAIAAERQARRDEQEALVNQLSSTGDGNGGSAVYTNRIDPNVAPGVADMPTAMVVDATDLVPAVKTDVKRPKKFRVLLRTGAAIALAVGGVWIVDEAIGNIGDTPGQATEQQAERALTPEEIKLYGLLSIGGLLFAGGALGVTVEAIDANTRRRNRRPTY